MENNHSARVCHIRPTFPFLCRFLPFFSFIFAKKNRKARQVLRKCDERKKKGEEKLKFANRKECKKRFAAEQEARKSQAKERSENFFFLSLSFLNFIVFEKSEAETARELMVCWLWCWHGGEGGGEWRRKKVISSLNPLYRTSLDSRLYVIAGLQFCFSTASRIGADSLCRN